LYAGRLAALTSDVLTPHKIAPAAYGRRNASPPLPPPGAVSSQ